MDGDPVSEVSKQDVESPYSAQALGAGAGDGERDSLPTSLAVQMTQIEQRLERLEELQNSERIPSRSTRYTLDPNGEWVPAEAIQELSLHRRSGFQSRLQQ